MIRKRWLTTSAGILVVGNQDSPAVIEYGPTLLPDVRRIDRVAHANRERIPNNAHNERSEHHD